jgi:hypothetical protein
VAKVEYINYLLKKSNVNVETKSLKKMTNNNLKISQTPQDLGMFPMVKRKDFKIVNVEMQAIVE